MMRMNNTGPCQREMTWAMSGGDRDRKGLGPASSPTNNHFIPADGACKGRENCIGFLKYPGLS